MAIYYLKDKGRQYLFSPLTLRGPSSNYNSFENMPFFPDPNGSRVAVGIAKKDGPTIDIFRYDTSYVPSKLSALSLSKKAVPALRKILDRYHLLGDGDKAGAMPYEFIFVGVGKAFLLNGSFGVRELLDCDAIGSFTTRPNMILESLRLEEPKLSGQDLALKLMHGLYDAGDCDFPFFFMDCQSKKGKVVDFI